MRISRRVLFISLVIAGCASSDSRKSDPALLVEAPAADEEAMLAETGEGAAASASEKRAERSGKPASKIPAPIDHDTEGVVLPLPESTTYPAVRAFMEEYRDAYMKFMPLSSDYRAYFSAVTSEEGGDAREAVKVRIREDFERAHWVYLYGVQELMDYLSSVSKGTLMVDREENFVARMKTITFLGALLTEVSTETKYREFARDVYVALSKKHFGRTVKAREGVRSPGK